MSGTIPHPTTQPEPVSVHDIENYGAASILNGAFVVGRSGEDAGPIIRHQVWVNCHVHDGVKHSTRAFALHEIPLLRRRCELAGGNVEIEPAWVPGISRRAGMQVAAVKREADRLLHLYELRLGQGEHTRMANCFHEVYGQGNDGLKVFADRMTHLLRAWDAMCQRLRKAKVKITKEQIEGVLETVFPASVITADTFDPEPQGDEDGIELGSGEPVEEITAGPLTAADERPLAEWLVSQGVSEDAARRFAAFAADAGGPDRLKAADWQQVRGCNLRAAGAREMRQRLADLTAAYCEARAPAVPE